MQDCTDRDITNRQVGDGVVAMAEKALLASLQQSYASSFRLAPVHERTVAAANGQSGAAREQPATQPRCLVPIIINTSPPTHVA